jgi:hypothetical protein
MGCAQVIRTQNSPYTIIITKYIWHEQDVFEDTKGVIRICNSNNKVFYDTAPKRAQNKYQYIAEEQ